jgi:hypothetical protein
VIAKLIIFHENRNILAFLFYFGGILPANFPDKRLREKGRFLNKTSLAAKYASFERFCKRLEISGL